MHYAVLTNDLQNAAAWKHPERRKAVEGFLPQMCELLDKSRLIGIPIIHLQLVTEPDDPRNYGMDDSLSFKRGSVGSQLLPEVYMDSDLIVEKPKDSGFYETNLDELLRAQNVDTLIITGMQAQICIQTTAADAYFRGFKVIVPSDAVVSTREEDKLRALDWLKNYCARVCTSQELFASIAEAGVERS